MVAPSIQPVIPEALLVQCDALPDAEEGKLPALMQNHIEVARLYHLCAQRHGALVDVVRGTQGKPDAP